MIGDPIFDGFIGCMLVGAAVLGIIGFALFSIVRQWIK